MLAGPTSLIPIAKQSFPLSDLTYFTWPNLSLQSFLSVTNHPIIMNNLRVA